MPDEIVAEIFPITGAASMASSYNYGMSLSDAKYKVYLRQDVFIINKNFINDITRIFVDNPDIGMIGMVGANEDHTGIPFDGINQYTFLTKKVRTFSKDTLDKLIKQTGFNHTYFYYPMPDYKLPTAIYSEGFLPRNENMLNMKYYYIPNDYTLVAQ